MGIELVVVVGFIVLYWAMYSWGSSLEEAIYNIEDYLSDIRQALWDGLNAVDEQAAHDAVESYMNKDAG